MKYTRPIDGTWTKPRMEGYKLACCDCGLVHTINFRVRRGAVEFQAYRSERSTALFRRWNALNAAQPTQ